MQNYPNQPQWQGQPQQRWTPPPPQFYPPRPVPLPYQPYPPQQQPQLTVNVARQETPMVIRLLYFLFIGWWLGLLWVSIAVCLICTIIGAPAGFIMLAMTGKVMLL